MKIKGTEVVNNGELIIINFIHADIAGYRKVAFVAMVALVSTITISDIILARTYDLKISLIGVNSRSMSDNVRYLSTRLFVKRDTQFFVI